VFFSAILVRSSNPTGLLIWCVLGFAAGIGLFVYGFRLLLRRRLILDTPFSKIRSASLGMVEVSGQAVGPYTMMAPVTGRPCYYHRTLVWEWKQSGKNKQWVKVAAECMHVPFFVDDNTGRLLIDPRGADLDLHRDFQQEFCDSFFTTKDPVPGNVRSFLARHGIVTNNKIKVEEYCIKPKNSLFILGTLAENPGIDVSPQPVRDAEPVNSLSGQGFSFSFNTLSFSSGGGGDNFEISSPAPVLATRSDARMVQVVRLTQQSDSGNTAGMTQQQKLAAALMKAGISNPAAWSAAGLTEPGLTTPGAQVMTDPSAIVTAPGTTGTGSNADPAAHANTFDPHPAVVLMKGTNNKMFLISWRSQQEVARSLGWKCALMIWGGPVLALVSLYFFLGIKNLL
jgi:hypothetical protein